MLWKVRGKTLVVTTDYEQRTTLPILGGVADDNLARIYIWLET